MDKVSSQIINLELKIFQWNNRLIIQADLDNLSKKTIMDLTTQWMCKLQMGISLK